MTDGSAALFAGGLRDRDAIEREVGGTRRPGLLPLCPAVLLWVVLVTTGATMSLQAQSTSGDPSATDDSLALWRLDAGAVARTCRGAVAAARSAVDTLLQPAPPPVPAFPRLQAVEDAAARLQNGTMVARALMLISPDSAVRDSSTACDQLVSNYTAESTADARLYALARRAEAELAGSQDAASDPPSGRRGAETAVDSATTAADRQLAKLYVETGRKAGAGLDSALRQRVVRLFQRHADLERDFGLALAADSARLRIPPSDTAGLDPQLRAQLAREGDSLTVPVDESTFFPFLQHQGDREARRRFFVAFWRRGGTANVARLDTALAVRDTLADLLGFPSWAAYQLSTKMARTPRQVLALLGSLEAPLRRKAVAEDTRLRPLARRDRVTGSLGLWDTFYYFEQLRGTRYALDENLVRAYFPVDHVVPAVMALYSELLGVGFTEVTPADAWAPGVRRFSVVDAASAAPLGRLYLDLFPRPHKYGHFADFDLVPTFRLPDGSRQLPWTAVVGNWPRPAADHPSLLAHGDVVTFFHEFGHAMASLLNHSPYVTTGVLRQDFVEAPSQMLESWMWQPDVLRRVSRHVETGAALPDSLIQRLLALKHLSDGHDWGFQVFIATYDMTLHGEHRPSDPTTTWLDLWPRFLPDTFPAGTMPAAGIPHFMGGYEAGYYGYLWAKVYAQDMFSRFEREGVLNRKTGRAYRDHILAPAGTEEPDILVRRFLGRPVSYAAFYRELGLSPAARLP